jgi:signal transduction histidine kinase
VEDYNSFYKFSIKDNGIGIEKRHFDSIFEIFQSLKKEKNSSGIGLSIVKKIVDMLKGEIWLESEIEKGTTFYFTIKK